MGGRSLGGDTVGMSESIGVGVLVFLTIFVTAIVGLNVLVVDEDSSAGPQANFTYDYVGENELLLVTHSRGDALEAGNIEFEGPSKTVTWAQLANRNNTSMVEPGDIAQLSSGNAYGQRVSARDTIEIYYNRSGNRTKLDEWSGG
ncbi:type IV pilin N-terminal domain-containing protein [Halomicroarcula sp. F13]|uniref:Type IV pilin N-terminal domain-containing protein n=1 Tax=Haloarcula rubra TaxID=2487747 RepID=A0AAW4PSJ7_9EURY|nr:type IV pilin [Halomicroarcula rubra]MBX0323520.1 type IV pilin N-terminal domain-containing protein [Halomicroarcula rubra]